MHTCSLTKTVVTGRCCEPLHPDKDQLNISKILAAQAPRGPGSKPLFITTKVPTPTSARDPTANCTQAYAQAKVHIQGWRICCRFSVQYTRTVSCIRIETAHLMDTHDRLWRCHRLRRKVRYDLAQLAMKSVDLVLIRAANSRGARPPGPGDSDPFPIGNA